MLQYNAVLLCKCLTLDVSHGNPFYDYLTTKAISDTALDSGRGLQLPTQQLSRTRVGEPSVCLTLQGPPKQYCAGQHIFFSHYSFQHGSSNYGRCVTGQAQYSLVWLSSVKRVYD